MSYETVILERQEGVAVITLNRPQVLNAFNLQMNTDLQSALREAEGDGQVGALVITGAGRAFCSGQDLKARQEILAGGETPHLGESIRQNYRPLILRLRNMEKPVIAALNGVAAGAGCSLALACDLRVAAEGATFVQSFVGVGLVPDCGALFFLPRLVGLGRALELAFRGEPVTAQEAERLGLVNQVVSSQDLMPATMELAKRFAQGPRKALALIKRGMNRSLEMDLEQALEYEAGLQEVCGRTEDFREAVMAFAEKRKPQFQGR